MNKALYNKFIVLLTSRLLQTNSLLDECIYHKFTRSKFLFKHFDMKDLDEASYILGLKIHRDRNKGI
jgi:hypothetical protein